MKTILLAFSSRIFFHCEELRHNLAGCQIALKTVEPARAELATVGAANLAGNANRPAIGFSPVKCRRGRDEHGLDHLTVIQPEKKLSRGIL